MTTYYIPQQLKDYAIFQYGSYWIYKNETTGVIDSSYIKYSPVFNYVHWGGYDTDPIYEICDIYYGGKFIASAHLQPMYDFGIDFNTWGSVCLKDGMFQSGIVYTIYNNVTLKYLSVIDTLNLNGNKYFHVLNTQYQSISLNGDTTLYSYYLCKSVGLIQCTKKFNNIDTIWTLLRYEIK